MSCELRSPKFVTLYEMGPTESEYGWLRGTVVERRSLTGELLLSCARPAADR